MAAIVKKTTSLFPADILNYRGLQQKSKCYTWGREREGQKWSQYIYEKEESLT